MSPKNGKGSAQRVGAPLFCLWSVLVYLFSLFFANLLSKPISISLLPFLIFQSIANISTYISYSLILIIGKGFP